MKEWTSKKTRELAGAVIGAVICISIIAVLCDLSEKQALRSHEGKFEVKNDGSQIPVGLETVFVDEERNLYIFKESLTSYMYLGYKCPTYTKYDVDSFMPLYDPLDGKPLSYNRFIELLYEKTNGSRLTYNRIEEILNSQ